MQLLRAIDYPYLCDSRHMLYAIVVGASQILLYAIGLPLLVFVFLWRHRNELNKPVVRFRYGLFFAGFRKKKYYWECRRLIY